MIMIQDVLVAADKECSRISKALHIAEVFVQQMLYSRRTACGLQLALVCCGAADAIGDRYDFIFSLSKWVFCIQLSFLFPTVFSFSNSVFFIQLCFLHPTLFSSSNCVFFIQQCFIRQFSLLNWSRKVIILDKNDTCTCVRKICKICGVKNRP